MISRTSTIASLLLCSAFLHAQPISRPNQANWKLADRLNNAIRVYNSSSSVSPGWINKTNQFWYVWKDGSGSHFYRVDPAAKKKTPLFDSAKMAALLSEVTKRPYDAGTLPITTITFTAKGDAIRFTVDKKLYEYDLAKETLAEVKPKRDGAKDDDGDGDDQQGGRRRGFGQARDFRNYSPDKKAFVYAFEHNLYLVEVVDGKEQTPVQLTKDGVKDYSFGSYEDRREFQQQMNRQNDDDQDQQQDKKKEPEKRVRAGVTWSSDSKRFFVSRSDQRKVKDLYLVNNLADPRPTLMTYKYDMPGEEGVAQDELDVYDRETKNFSKLKLEKWKDQQIMFVAFPEREDKTAKDKKADISDRLRFVRRDRLQRNAEFCEIDLGSGKITPLVTESVENAYLELQPPKYMKPGGDFVWFSERDGWGHYYRYSNDGKLKNAVTTGPWRSDAIMAVDADKDLLWVRGEGREPGENPYNRHLYRVKADGKNLQLLDTGDADHASALSPDQKFIVDTASRVDLIPKAVLRDGNGRELMELETMDLTPLIQSGWTMPERFTVKAADGVTEIDGNLYKPMDFDPSKRYPIIAHVYPGPQTESVSNTFSVNAADQRLAQLGFIVVQIGNRGGNPARSNAYHSYGYYNLRDYGLADKKAGIEQLAARYPWIDLDRVGIYGHSGGGFMTAAALLLPPYNDFFKVGVSSSGNHDNNIYNANWSEQHHGLKEVEVKDKDGKVTGTKFEIKVPTTVELAPNLKGALLLVTGDMDNNVHPANTIRLVNALIKANKRFDFMIMPGQAHGYGPMQGYFTQMMMEYFAEHLLGDYYHSNADMGVKK